MKKIFLALAICITAVFTVTLILDEREELSEPTPQNMGRSTSSQESEGLKEPLYTLKEYDGRIAVFSKNGETPILSLDSVLFEGLPEYDRRLLKSGIEIYSNEELRRLIEDYDS